MLAALLPAWETWPSQPFGDKPPVSLKTSSFQINKPLFSMYPVFGMFTFANLPPVRSLPPNLQEPGVSAKAKHGPRLPLGLQVPGPLPAA